MLKYLIYHRYDQRGYLSINFLIFYYISELFFYYSNTVGWTNF